MAGGRVSHASAFFRPPPSVRDRHFLGRRPTPFAVRDAYAYVMNPTHANAIAADFESVVQRLEGRRVMPCEWQGLPAFAKRLYRRRPLERALLMSFAPVLRAWLVGNFAFKPARRDSPRDHPTARVETRGRTCSASAGMGPRRLHRRVGRAVAGAVAPAIKARRATSRIGGPRSRRPGSIPSARPLARRRASTKCRRDAPGAGTVRLRSRPRSTLSIVHFEALDALLFLSSLQRLRDESMLRLAARCYFGVAPPTVIAVIR